MRAVVSRSRSVNRSHADGRQAPERCSPSYVIRERKTKTRGRHGTPIGRAQIQTLTSPNAGEDAEQQALSSLLVGTQRLLPPWKTGCSLSVPFKTKHTLTIQASNRAPRHPSKGAENRPTANLRRDV